MKLGSADVEKQRLGYRRWPTAPGEGKHRDPLGDVSRCRLIMGFYSVAGWALWPFQS